MVRGIVSRIVVFFVLCTLTATSLEDSTGDDKTLSLDENNDTKESDRRVLKSISTRNLANLQDSDGYRKLTFTNPHTTHRTRFGNSHNQHLYGGFPISSNIIFPGGIIFNGAGFSANSDSFTSGNGIAGGNAVANFQGVSATSSASSAGHGFAFSTSFGSAVIFDAQNPTGEGNFIGKKRTATLGNVLIVNKDSNFTVPDTDKAGGFIEAMFLMPVTLRAFRAVNVLKRNGFIEVYGEEGLLQNKTLPFTGIDRSRYVWFQQQEGVTGFRVVSLGSFAIDDVIFVGPEVIIEEEDDEETIDEETTSLMF